MLSDKQLAGSADILTIVDIWYSCEDLSYQGFSWFLLTNSQQPDLEGYDLQLFERK